jgi:hypothetical protein
MGPFLLLVCGNDTLLFRVTINFDSECQWIGKILQIEGSKALIHFDGWKPQHDDWVPRKLLADLPPPEVLAKAVHGRIPTKAEEEKLAKSGNPSFRCFVEN